MGVKVILALLALVAVSAYAKPNKAPLLATDSPTAIENSYIVVIKEEVSDEDFETHKTLSRKLMEVNGEAKMKFEYNIGKGFRGYSIHADEKTVGVIQSMEEVKYIEQNQEAHALQGTQCEYQSTAEWGLHRTIDRNLKPGNEFYEYHADGDGVDAYIIDTGIYLEHNEFGGRAKFGYDSVDNPSPEDDPNGHGTHVAGTVIGNTYGLARKATAIAVRVLNAFGSGSYEGVIAGVDYTGNQHSSGKKSVANMSLGGSKSQAMNDAVDAAIDKGVHFAIAAGNSNDDACNYSPASSKSVTVASTDSTDTRSYFSSYGTCVEIFAPGSAIKSAYPGSPTNTATLSGTSMAAPHVCGVMAKIISDKGNMSPDDLLKELEDLATKDKVTNPGSGTPNKLLYHPCGEPQEQADDPNEL